MPNDRPAAPAARAAAAGPNGKAAHATPLRWVPPGFKTRNPRPPRPTGPWRKSSTRSTEPTRAATQRQASSGSTGLTHLYLLWEEMLHHFQVAEKATPATQRERHCKD